MKIEVAQPRSDAQLAEIARIIAFGTRGVFAPPHALPESCLYCGRRDAPAKSCPGCGAPT